MPEMFEQNFMTGFSQLCAGTEIPIPFSVWSAISAISCCLGRRVWMDMGTYTIYPNCFTVLVGSSGRVRKSTSIAVATGLLSKLEAPAPKLIGQKITTEALIKALSYTEEMDPRRLGAPADAVGFVAADELITFLNRNAYEAGLGAVLIQTYDCLNKFEYTTVARGKETLSRTCLGLLGGTTIDWLAQAIPESAVGGGLTSRIMFVYVKDPAPPVAITTYSEEKKRLEAKLIETLSKIQRIEGEISVSGETTAQYEKDYIHWWTKGGEKFFANKSLSGYASRRFAHIWKLAICLTCSESDTRVIELRHYIAAVSFIEQVEANLPMVLELVTSSIQGNILAEIVAMICANPKGILKSLIIRAFSNRLNLREIEVLLETICQSHQAEQKFTSDTNSQIYYVPGKIK